MTYLPICFPERNSTSASCLVLQVSSLNPCSSGNDIDYTTCLASRTSSSDLEEEGRGTTSARSSPGSWRSLKLLPPCGGPHRRARRPGAFSPSQSGNSDWNSKRGSRPFPSRRASGKEAEGQRKGAKNCSQCRSQFPKPQSIGLEGWTVWGHSKVPGNSDTTSKDMLLLDYF